MGEHSPEPGSSEERSDDREPASPRVTRSVLARGKNTCLPRRPDQQREIPGQVWYNRGEGKHSPEQGSCPLPQGELLVSQP